MIKNINVRFFTYAMTDGSGVDIVEITERCFKELNGTISYERNSIHANGCRQICLTVEVSGCYPETCDLDIIE